MVSLGPVFRVVSHKFVTDTMACCEEESRASEPLGFTAGRCNRSLGNNGGENHQGQHECKQGNEDDVSCRRRRGILETLARLNS